MTTFGIHYATDPLIQTMTSVPLLTYFQYFQLKTLKTMLIYGSQFFRIRVFFCMLYRCNEFGDFHYWISDISNSLSDHSKNLGEKYNN